MASHGDQVHENDVVIQCQEHRQKVFRDGFVFMLQEVLEPSSIIPAKTCRYARCPHADSIMPAGNYCLSLEPRASCDPKRQHLGYLPLAPLNKVKQTKKGRHGKYGLGKRREERYCVECYEVMLQIYRRRRPNAIPLPGHPIFEIMYCIDCEERTIEDLPWLGPLDPSIRYGIDLFKARWLWNRRQANPRYMPTNTPHSSEFIRFLPGRDPKSLYINEESREYRGKFKDGTTAEIPGDEVDNCSLSDALTRLVRRRTAHEEANNERDRLASHSAYSDDYPLDDPSDFGPASPRRVNPPVPVVRSTQDPPRARGGEPDNLQNGKPAESRPPKDNADWTDAPKTSDATAPPAKAQNPAKGDKPSNQATTGSRATKSPPLSGSASSSVNTKRSITPSKATSSTPDKPTSSKHAGHSPSTKDIQKGKYPAPVTATGSATLKSAPSTSANPTRTSPSTSSQGEKPTRVTALGSGALKSPPPASAKSTRTSPKPSSQSRSSPSAFEKPATTSPNLSSQSKSSVKGKDAKGDDGNTEEDIVAHRSK